MTITSPLEWSVSNQRALNVSHLSGRSALILGVIGEMFVIEVSLGRVIRVNVCSISLGIGL